MSLAGHPTGTELGTLDAGVGCKSNLSAMTVPVERALPGEDVLGTLRSLRECRGQFYNADETLPVRLLAVLEAGDEHHADLVRSVCELATDSDPLVSRRGQELLFSSIAEALGDSFAPSSVNVHDSVFSYVVEFCRRLPGGSHLDARLNRFGIRNRADLLDRRSTLTPTLPISKEARGRVRKVFVLSRITLGADVAITSAVLQVIQRVFPNADRYLLGPPGIGQLLAGLSGARIIEQSYDTSGLLERLDSWHRVTQMLDRETTGLADFEWLVIDPDSRVTQLGMLPVARPTVPYLFFESRSYCVAGLETLGELATHWSRRALGWVDDEAVRPRVALSPIDVGHAKSIVHALKRGKAPFVVAANLGVGGNPRKRVPGEFELNLIRELLREGSGVILDHGAGEDEARVRAIVEALQSEGRRVGEVAGSDFGATRLPTGCDVLAYRGHAGPFAALTGASDMYVGYDSAFQHIAAAQGIPVVDIFVNPPNVVFPRRWRPHSSAAVTVIETTSDDTPNSSLTRIANAHRRFRQAAVVP